MIAVVPPLPSSVSVTVETAGGYWSLFREPSPDNQVVAFYQPLGPDATEGAPQGHVRGSTWQVEEGLGFPLPRDVHLALHADDTSSSFTWPARADVPVESAGVLPDDSSLATRAR